MLDTLTVQHHNKRKRPKPRRLDAQPLLEYLERTEQMGREERRMASIWVRTGLSIFKADRLAIRYGTHPAMLWGLDFYTDGSLEDDHEV